jgi:hypothetical protein
MNAYANSRLYDFLSFTKNRISKLMHSNFGFFTKSLKPWISDILQIALDQAAA